MVKSKHQKLELFSKYRIAINQLIKKPTKKLFEQKENVKSDNKSVASQRENSSTVKLCSYGVSNSGGTPFAHVIFYAILTSYDNPIIIIVSNNNYNNMLIMIYHDSQATNDLGYQVIPHLCVLRTVYLVV